MARVLLVDDEMVFRASLAQRLRLRGYAVTEAGDGTEAIGVARCDPEIDIVIMDCRMPGMKGERALREIKTLRPAVEVIMLTAYGVDRVPEAASILRKPCDLEDLIRAIESARRKRVRPAGNGSDPADPLPSR